MQEIRQPEHILSLETRPRHAEAYKQQIKEIEQMNCSRKITPKEGPVQYASHGEGTKPEKKSTPVRIV